MDKHDLQSLIEEMENILQPPVDEFAVLEVLQEIAKKGVFREYRGLTSRIEELRGEGLLYGLLEWMDLHSDRYNTPPNIECWSFDDPVPEEHTPTMWDYVIHRLIALINPKAIDAPGPFDVRTWILSKDLADLLGFEPQRLVDARKKATFLTNDVHGTWGIDSWGVFRRNCINTQCAYDPERLSKRAQIKLKRDS